MSNQRTVLVFDDDQEIRQLLTMLAEKEGFRVHSVSSFNSFKDSIAINHPDVIIQDLSLDDCDGVEVLRYLGAQNCKSSIILISSFDERLIKSAVNLGEDFGLTIIGNMRKPISGAGLRELLALVPEVSQTVRQDDLEHAIGSDQLYLNYQPKVDMKTKKVTSAEALVRWKDPKRGTIFPDEFISLAEKSGLIKPMTDQILELAIREAAVWKEMGWDIAVGVNLSASTLTDLDFPTKVSEILKRYQVPTSQLILEVTETTAMSDPKKTLDILTRLRIKGISISIDDFGTGYSSLVELHKMPFSELKIDRSFVLDSMKDKDAKIITNAILGLAKAMELKVVAEGVETEEHWDFLLENDCDVAQGYYLSRPVPAAEFIKWVEDWNAQL